MILASALAFSTQTVEKGGPEPEMPVPPPRRALHTAPSHAPALYGLALCAEQEGDAAAAESAYLSAAAADPTHTNAWNNLGRLRDVGGMPGAEEAYEKALGTDPAHVTTLYNYGSLLQTKGAYGEAEGMYRRALATAGGGGGLGGVLCNYGLLLEVRSLGEASLRSHSRTPLRTGRCDIGVSTPGSCIATDGGGAYLDAASGLSFCDPSAEHRPLSSVQRRGKRTVTAQRCSTREPSTSTLRTPSLSQTTPLCWPTRGGTPQAQWPSTSVCSR